MLHKIPIWNIPKFIHLFPYWWIFFFWVFLVFASKVRITGLLCSGSLLTSISILTFQGLWLSWILFFCHSHHKMSFPWEFGYPHRAGWICCQGRSYENVKLTRSIPSLYIQFSSFICLLSGVFVFWFYFLIFMRIYCYLQNNQYSDSRLVFTCIVLIFLHLPTCELTENICIGLSPCFPELSCWHRAPTSPGVS